MRPTAAAPGARTARAAWVSPILVLLAIGFQVQVTPAPWGDPVRFSAADALSALVLAVCAAGALRGDLRWPVWRLPRLGLWLAGLSAVLTVALVLGYAKSGTLSSWVLLNKYAGWFALLWYLALGGWTTSVLGERGQATFLRAFLIFCWAAAAFSLVGHGAERLGYAPLLGRTMSRPEGFMQNPNAFAYLVDVAIVLQAPFLKNRRLFPFSLHVVGLAVAVAVVILSGSRSGWLGLAVAIPVLLFYRAVDFRATALALAGAALIMAAFLPGSYVVEQGLFLGTDVGVVVRVQTGLSALALWSQAPLFGIGLGGFLKAQAAGTVPPVVIHNTFLWLLTEAGLAGAVPFSLFFLVCVRALGRGVSAPPAPDHLLRLGMLAAMFVFAGASLGMEALYQRHLWFLLGCALAVPRAGRRWELRGHGSAEAPA